MQDAQFTPLIYRAYVDESGDEGFSFDKGSPEWFVMAAVVFPEPLELELVKSIVDGTRDQINAHRREGNKIPDKKPLHFRDLKHEERRLFAKRIGELPTLKWIAVAFNKAMLSRENFPKSERLYFYALRFLVERISWCCRDWHSPAQPHRVDLAFANRANLKPDNLRDYLNRLSRERGRLKYRATDNLNLDNIMVLSSGKRLGLQVADAVASSVFYALQPNKFGMTEEGYLKLLWDRAYRHRGRVWCYGLKLFPREADALRQRRVILSDFVRLRKSFAGPRP